ncbi:MAG: ribonuclease HII, partial [Clostridia bacterium]|nr:ribonuclease HII [Clostridia bacterium]
MDNLAYERKHIQNGLSLVAGVDEVGRGPLAGPVVCCAVIMPTDEIIDGVT